MSNRLTEQNRTALKVSGYCNTYLTAEQYAKAVGCSKATVYYWQVKGYAEARAKGLVP